VVTCHHRHIQSCAYEKEQSCLVPVGGINWAGWLVEVLTSHVAHYRFYRRNLPGQSLDRMADMPTSKTEEKLQPNTLQLTTQKTKKITYKRAQKLNQLK